MAKIISRDLSSGTQCGSSWRALGDNLSTRWDRFHFARVVLSKWGARNRWDYLFKIRRGTEKNLESHFFYKSLKT